MVDILEKHKHRKSLEVQHDQMKLSKIMVIHNIVVYWEGGEVIDKIVLTESFVQIILFLVFVES